MFKKRAVIIPVLLSLLALIAAPGLNAQNLTLEGQTGGFITPTAYVVYSAKKQFFDDGRGDGHHIRENAVPGPPGDLAGALGADGHRQRHR